jgi:hypothetical protein
MAGSTRISTTPGGAVRGGIGVRVTVSGRDYSDDLLWLGRTAMAERGSCGASALPAAYHPGTRPEEAV